MRLRVLPLLVICLALCGATLPAQAAVADLPYAEGGPSVEDPGAQVEHAFYVDQAAGDDRNPGTKEAPWRTLQKVKAHMESGPPAGAHYLLRRGRTWEESIEVRSVSGAPGARIVLGAYGPLTDPRPLVRGSIIFANGSSYLMVRDLEVEGVKGEDGRLVVSARLFFSTDSHNGIIYNNVVHGAQNNAIGAFRNAHHMVFARNFVYDLETNDGLSMHAQNWPPDPGELGSHHWIIDNVVVGNDGMEEPIDVASDIAQDIKIIGNYVQPLSIFGQGSSHKAMTVGHGSRYYWLIGNTMAGSTKNPSIKLGTDAGVPWKGNEKIQVSGNIIYGGHYALDIKAKHVHIEHNTFINTRGILLQESAEDIRLYHNLAASAIDSALSVVKSVPDTVAASDHNAYYCYSLGAIACSAKLAGLQLAQWQNRYHFYGFDANSLEVSPEGISMPGSSWSDPRQWNNQDFWSHFIPASTWAERFEHETPGAFDSHGNRLGMEILPMAGLDLNGGYGWEGTPLVREILSELGITFIPAEKRPLLFDERLRPEINWTVPQLQRPGKLPIDLEVKLPDGVGLESVRVELIGRQVIYEGSELPTDLTLDAALLPAGQHQIGVTVLTAAGGASLQTWRVFTFKVPEVIALRGVTSSFIRGQVRMQVELNIPEGGVLERALVTFDDEVLYEGAAAPGSVEIDTLSYTDGAHRIEAAAIVTRGGEATAYSTKVDVMLSNWWELVDELLPPQSGWFGSIDQLKVSARSAGWIHETGSLAAGDDNSRLRPAGTASEYLTWSTPQLRQFSVTVLAPPGAPVGSIILSVSADQQTWLPLEPIVEVQDDGYVQRVRLAGEVHADTAAAWFRISVEGGEGADQLQLGRVELRGVKTSLY